ncbi:MAG: LPS export ABC transporter periplasmic protein LptC, partial [bacterium]
MNNSKTTILILLCLSILLLGNLVGAQTVPSLSSVLPSGDLLVPTGKVNLKAHKIALSSNVYTLSGNVHVKANNMTVDADEASYDVARNIVAARGNVVFTTDKGASFRGEGMQVNIVTRHWEFLEWSTAFSANSLGKPFLDSLYAGGAKVEGLPNEIIASDTYLTTCNHLDDPHYEIRAGELDIFPGDKIIARNCEVFLLGKMLFRIPWFFISLRDYRSPIVPEFGSNDTEGYYMRLRYQYVMNDNNYGNVRLDTTTKRGEGLGIDHFYTLPGGKGEVFLYGRDLLKEYVVRVDHKQLITPLDLNVDFHGDIRQDSQFTDTPTTITSLSLNLSGPSTQPMWRAGYSEQKTDGVYGSDSTNANLGYTAPAVGGNLQYNTDYSSYGSSGTAKNQDMWNHL